MAKLTRAQVVERVRDAAALAAVRRVRYGLGKGGMKGDSHVPWTRALECDCTGLAGWAFGSGRFLDGAWWMESTNIANDAKGPATYFEVVPDGRAMPGHLLVIPDSDRNGDGRIDQGHVAIITAVDPRGRATDMVDCSVSNAKKGAAIRERPAGEFPRNAIVVRFKSLQD